MFRIFIRFTNEMLKKIAQITIKIVLNMVSVKLYNISLSLIITLTFQYIYLELCTLVNNARRMVMAKF